MSESKTPYNKQEMFWLVYVPMRYKYITIVLMADLICSINSFTYNCNVFLLFILLRQILAGFILLSHHHQQGLPTLLSLLAFLIQLVIMVGHVSFLLFSNKVSWSRDLIYSIIMNCLFSFGEFHFLTSIHLKDEHERTRAIWRASKKAKGQMEALRKDDERRQEEKELSYKKVILTIAPYFMPRSRWVMYTAFGVIVNVSIRTFFPFINAKILDSALAKDWDCIKFYLVLRIVLTVGQSASHYLQAYYQRLVREWVEFDLRCDMFKAAMKCEVGYYDAKSTGQITGVMHHNVGRVTETLGWELRCLLEFVIRTIWIIFLILQMDFRLAICSCFIAPMMASGLKYFNGHCAMLSRMVRDTWDDLDKTVNEDISNIRTVKIFGCEQWEFNRFFNLLKETWATLEQEIWYCETRWSFCNFLPQVSNIMLLYFGISLVCSNDLTIGQLTAFISYQGSINWILNDLADKVKRLKQISVQSHKVFKLLRRECELPRNGSEKPVCSGRFEFKNVNFSYPTKKDQTVLHNLSMDVKPGEVVALVGESGGGKSTIVKLMAYLYGPGVGNGEILLDGIPVSQWDPIHFSRNVVCVPQEPVLFSRSLHKNIAYGLDLSREQVVEAAKMANAHEFIIKLDKGYDSVVGERGITLSGGQRQRICIARALARKPTVLLLDEATSALDTKSEHLVHKAIDDIICDNKRSVSVVIVAHRLSTVMNADRIFVINEGKIIQEGNHKELMSIGGGAYSELVKQQLLVKKEDVEPSCTKPILTKSPSKAA